MSKRPGYTAEKLDCWLQYKHERTCKEILERSIKPLQLNRQKRGFIQTLMKNEFAVDLIRSSPLVKFRDKLTMRATASYANSCAEITMLERRIRILREVCRARAEYSILLYNYLNYFDPLNTFMEKVAHQLNLKTCMEVIYRYTTLTRVKQEGEEEYEQLVTRLSDLKEEGLKKRQTVAHTNLILSNQKVQLIDDLRVLENEVNELNISLNIQLMRSTGLTRTIYQAELMVENIYDNLTRKRGKPANATTLFDKLDDISIKLTTLMDSTEALIKRGNPTLTKIEDIPRYSMPVIRPTLCEKQIASATRLSKKIIRISNANFNNQICENASNLVDNFVNIDRGVTAYVGNSCVDELLEKDGRGEIMTCKLNNNNSNTPSEKLITPLQRQKMLSNIIKRTEVDGSQTHTYHHSPSDGIKTVFHIKLKSKPENPSGCKKTYRFVKSGASLLESNSHTGILSSKAGVSDPHIKSKRQRVSNSVLLRSSKSSTNLVTSHSQEQKYSEEKHSVALLNHSRLKMSSATVSRHGCDHGESSKACKSKKIQGCTQFRPLTPIKEQSLFPSIPLSKRPNPSS